MADDLNHDVSTPHEPKALAKRPPMMLGNRGFEFDFESAQRFAKGLIEGGMVPKTITSPGAVLGIMQAGKELGLPPMYALSNLTFTNGRLGIMGDAAKALIRNSGVLKPGTDFDETYSGAEFTSEWKCTVTAHRDGQPKPFVASFSLADAVIARLVRLNNGQVFSKARGGEWGDSGPWSTYTKRMLKYRALGFLVRDHFSDVIGGLTTTEELRDYGSMGEYGEATPPQEPDPLLVGSHDVIGSSARETEASATTTQADEVIDVVEMKSEPAPGTVSPTPDEVTTIRAIEKLEGDIVTADTRERLDAIWSAAKPLLAAVSGRQRKQLSKLYEQNVSAFEIQTTLAQETA